MPSKFCSSVYRCCMVRVSCWLAFCNYNKWLFKPTTSCRLFYNASFTASFWVMANQKIVEMFPTVWANSLDRSKWSSKIFNEDRTKGARTFLVFISGGKSPFRTKNEVLRWWQSLVGSLELCAMFPLEKYFGGVSNFGICLTKISSPSRHRCNWLERFIGD